MLDGRFDLLGCSPRFLTDWRWHKQRAAGLGWVTDAYWTQAHNLLDARRMLPPQSRVKNEAIAARCQMLRQAIAAYEAGQVGCPEVEPPAASWFGRGQQYLSLVRTA